MQIDTVNGEAGVDVNVRGRMDSHDSTLVETELDEIIRRGDHRVRLFLGGVDFMSSAGLRVLIKYHREFKRLGGFLSIVESSKSVRSVLELSGLASAFAPSRDSVVASVSSTESAASAASEKREYEKLTCTIYTQSSAASFSCRMVGDPTKLEDSQFVEADAFRLKVTKDVLAVGLGAFGDRFSECRTRFGEFLATGGTAIYLPGDGTKTPDYLLPRGAMVPEVQILYGLILTGGFSGQIRFEAKPSGEKVPLSEILRSLSDLSLSGSVGFVMLADTAGVVGGAVRRAPTWETKGPRFDFPSVREWFSLTPERVHDRQTALVCGLVSVDPDPPLVPFLRPIDRGAKLLGHCHCAIFSYKALPQGPLPFDETILSLCDGQRLIDVLHLLSDHREIFGMGESLFDRGILWFGPVQKSGAGG